MLGTLPERLCCGYPSLNDIISSGKRKDLRSIGHPLKFLLSLLCPLQLLGAEAAQNLQASRAWCRERVLAGKETQELLLMWMGQEHFQNLTEEVCRWRLIVMEKSISFSYWTDLHLAKSVVKVSWHLYPETLVLVMASFLHTHWWQHWYQKGKVFGTSWEPWQGGCLCFCRQTRWCLGVSKKVWILVPEDRESPSTEGKEAAGGWWRGICYWGKVQACPDVQLEEENKFLVPHHSAPFVCVWKKIQLGISLALVALAWQVNRSTMLDWCLLLRAPGCCQAPDCNWWLSWRIFNKDFPFPMLQFPSSYPLQCCCITRSLRSI